MILTVMAALAQMELEIKRERITDSVATLRAATQMARDRGMSRNALYRRVRELPTAAVWAGGSHVPGEPLLESGR
jgi:DNA invertase Pin-like site-specific DNA recombinase